ncbi:hypothetical protein ONS96_003766 [Cadophora gregata f. sp. sojae]|nr:hypothetical protein ONS96_003766 [Cadophora gregata f. sp. sojae]
MASLWNGRFKWDKLPDEVKCIIVEHVPDFVSYNSLAKLSKAVYKTLTLPMGREVVSRLALEDARRMQSPAALLDLLRRIRLDAPIVYGIHMQRIISIYDYEYLCGQHLQACYNLMEKLMRSIPNKLSGRYWNSTHPPQSYLDLFREIQPLISTQIVDHTWGCTFHHRFLNHYHEGVWGLIGSFLYTRYQNDDNEWNQFGWSTIPSRILAPQKTRLFADSTKTTLEELYLEEAYIRLLSLVELPFRRYEDKSTVPKRLHFQDVAFNSLGRLWEKMGSERDVAVIAHHHNCTTGIVRRWMNIWELFDQEEYAATCTVLEILDSEALQIKPNEKKLDDIHETWVK